MLSTTSEHMQDNRDLLEEDRNKCSFSESLLKYLRYVPPFLLNLYILLLKICERFLVYVVQLAY